MLSIRPHNQPDFINEAVGRTLGCQIVVDGTANQLSFTYISYKYTSLHVPPSSALIILLIVGLLVLSS